MKSCLDLNFHESSAAATVVSERFFDSICGLDSIRSNSAIIVHSAGDFKSTSRALRQFAETYGKDTSNEIRFSF